VSEKMSESLNKLKEKAEQVKEYLSVTDLPKEIEAKMVGDLQFKTDKRGNEACFITLQTKEGKYVVQKYTSTNYAYLYDKITSCGGMQKLQTEYHLWVKERVGRSINERLFPQPKHRREK
jgi:hypothetical protein